MNKNFNIDTYLKNLELKKFLTNYIALTEV